jgi:hypothetical protein
MRRFKVMIEGRNVTMRLDERVARMGFFATRLIESETVEMAKQAAVKLITIEVMDLIVNARDDPPLFVVEDAIEVGAGDVDSSLSGFTWYPEERVVP